MADLRTELLTDPLGRGYAGMSDQQVAADLNTEYRSRNIDILTASEVLNATDDAERDALSNANETTLWRLLAIGDLNPWGAEAQIMISLFGGGSATIAALQALRVQNISRARELNLPFVKVGHVEEARR